MDYPHIMVDIDRERAGMAGLTVAKASNSLIAATSSSRYVVPVYWVDPKSGIGYQVQIQIPPERMNSIDEVGMIPVRQMQSGQQVLLRDIAGISDWHTMPEEIDRLNQLRFASLTANIDGEDLGHASLKVQEAIAAAGELPRGVRVEVPRAGASDESNVRRPGHRLGTGGGGGVLDADGLFPVPVLGPGQHRDHPGRGGRRGDGVVADAARP